MSSETDTVPVNPRQLPADSFTDSDIARITMVRAAESRAARYGKFAQMVSEDLAQSGDYVRQAVRAERSVEGTFVTAAVIAERVRGTGWEVIGEAARMSAEEAEQKWGSAESQWRRASRADDLYRKKPGAYAAATDRYLVTDKPYQPSAGRPLSASLDAAAHLTGRDVAAADRAFAGTPSCAHCSR
ncbi:hypothetical protein [Streptomyces sp. ML-6]|uniref:hypothetical protein n=1 Tax=Streptomyces sp. ML-6 TaxID=2982693 RepID=UPI0024BF4F95|nr:hypothetical protein [Streptomyces sp. ML-6]MDK0524874.1 hypothetical protein [Streptomyces sp. ML-6]